MLAFLDKLWVTRIFAQEFGFSDVQANYSRTYAWMANQLGHMTLGMATAFFFVWIQDTMAAFAGLFEGCKCLPGVNKPLGLDAFNYWLNHLLLAAVALAILAAAVVILMMNAKAKPTPLTAKECSFYTPMPQWLNMVFSWATLFVLVGGMGLTLYSMTQADTPLQTRETYLSWFGVIVACCVVTAAILKLCRELPHFILAMIAVFGAFWIATHGAGAEEPARQAIAVVLSLFFLFYPAYALAISPAASARLERKEKVQQIVFIAILAGIFGYASINGLEEEWRMPIAGATCSLAIWWVKEFGSDLPNVYKEISDAAAKRPGNVLGECSLVEREYADDARMDARTDGMFYFAGAWIGAGVLSASPSLTADIWGSGSELLGLGVFLFIFIIMGETWAFRQQALDFMGAEKAGRLAVFHSALRLVIEPKPGEPTAYEPEPLDFLRHFAAEDWAPGDEHFEHLIIIGPPGSGVTPLGRAIASEAALSSLSTFKKVGNLEDVRTARFIDISSLEHFMRDLKTRRDISANPTVDLLINRETGAVTRPTGGHDDKIYERRKGADLVVIDDLTTTNLAPAFLDRLIDNLKVEALQNTVWLVETDPDLSQRLTEIAEVDADDWTPDPEAFRPQVDAIADALERQAGGAQKVGVGFVRRVAR